MPKPTLSPRWALGSGRRPTASGGERWGAMSPLGSIQSFDPGPAEATYGATKAYCCQFYSSFAQTP